MGGEPPSESPRILPRQRQRLNATHVVREICPNQEDENTRCHREATGVVLTVPPRVSPGNFATLISASSAGPSRETVKNVLCGSIVEKRVFSSRGYRE